MKTRMIQVGEVCEFAYGDSLKEDRRRAGKVPVYGSNGIVGWHDEAITNGPTIVIGRKGSFGEVNWSSEPCFPIDTTYYVEKTKKPCDLRWLYFTLIKLDLTRFNKSAAVPGLNRDDAYEQLIPFPELPEQQRIAEQLEQADRLRRTRRYALEFTDTFLPAAFLQLFGDPIMNPRAWERARVCDLGRVETGSTPPREDKTSYGDAIEWIKSDNIALDSLHPARATEMLSERGVALGTMVDAGSLLVTCIAGSVRSIGNVVITDRRVAFNQQINAITPRTDVVPLFLYGLMLTAKPLIQRSSTEAMKRMITKSKLEELMLIKPPLALQQQFAALVERVERLRSVQRESLRQADHLFASLLHTAFATG